MIVEHSCSKKWIHCVYCNEKQFPIDRKTRISNLHWKCKRCKKLFNIGEPEPKSREPINLS